MRNAPVDVRFWRYVEPEPTTGCWLWTSALNEHGYATIWHGKHRRTVSAHRFSYELAHGSIPDDLTLDHLCRVRSCVNPAHLEPCSQWENTSRSPSNVVALNARKTACPSGHPYVGANVIRRGDSSRHCRECDILRKRTARRAARGGR